MAGLTTPYENAVNDYLFGSVSLVPPATWYWALFVTLPNDAGIGGIEAAFSGYARAASPNDLSSFTVASGGAKTNRSLISWGTAGSGPTTITGVGLYDAASSGNLWAFGPLTAALTINNGQQALAATGTITIRID